MRVILENAEQTAALGRLTARAFLAADGGPVPPCVYLRGGLGGGKTTFARGFVEALPGGDAAEVASPSFTLCNEYPTAPRVLHADLYRLSPGSSLPEEVEEALDARDGESLLLLEWPDRLDPALIPPDRLDIAFGLYPEQPDRNSPLENLDILIQPCERKRLASVTAYGGAASRLLERLLPLLESCFATPPA